jgi:hypothetical protein
MANQTVTVLEADGVTSTDVEVLGFGRQAAAASKSTAMSTEDKAVLDAMAASLVTIDGRVDGLETLITSTNTKLDTAITALQIIDNMVLSAGTNNIGDVDVLTIGGQTPAFGDGAKGATVLRTTLATDSAGIITVGTAGSPSSQVVSMQGVAGGTPVPATGVSALRIITMSTDTGAYASGDLIADTQQYDGFFRVSNGTGIINTITVTEKDAQGAAIYIIIHRTSTSMGSENSAPNISDANLVAGIQHIIPVGTADYVTVSGTKIATLKNLGLPVMAVSGTDDLYISILNSTGTPTYASGEIQLGIGVMLD